MRWKVPSLILYCAIKCSVIVLGHAFSVNVKVVNTDHDEQKT